MPEKIKYEMANSVQGARPVPQWFIEAMRQVEVDRHKQTRASWPWYGRLQHWLFCSWRCPACKELRRQAHEKTAAYDHTLGGRLW